MKEHGSKTIISGLFWRFMERFGAQLVSFVVSVFLARVLDPEVYGTVAIVTVFIALAQVFVDGGLGNSLIQKKDADHLDFSTVFYANVFLCASLYLILYGTAPYIASFYENEQLIPIIRVLGITLIISGLKNVQQAYVSKNMLFKKFFFSTLGGTIAAAVVGILAALNGAGVWALVLQQMVNVTIDTIVLWFTVRWRPKLEFSFDRLKSLYTYGWKLLVSALIDRLYSNMYQLVIGKYYSSQDLAYYNKADQLPSLVVTNINTSIDSVLLPAMSEKQDDTEAVKRLTRRAILTSMYIMSPIMIGLACVAEEVIIVLLTDKWIDAVPFLRVFCIVYLFYPIFTANLNAIKAVGRSDLFLRMEIIKKIVGIFILFISANISVEAMAYGLVVMSLISQIINTWYNEELIGYGFWKQVKDVLPNIFITSIMAICVSIVGWMDIHILLKLIIKVVIGAVSYIGLSLITKNEMFMYLYGQINNIYKSRRG